MTIRFRAVILAPAILLAPIATFLVAQSGAMAADGAGGHATSGDIVVEAAWLRGTPPRAPVAAGYLVVTNRGDAADRLVGGSAPFAGRVEIHEMAMQDGMMRMAEIEGGLVIAPGTTEVLEPGGNHVMFMDLSDAPAPGETIPVTLEFAEAGSMTVDMPVSAIGASSFEGD